MTDLVDQMFPPIHRKLAAEFTDFNFWRAPVQEFELPNLEPPSPTLSARSDASGQSRLTRLRNFTLIRGSPSRESLAAAGVEAARKKAATSSSPLASPVLTAAPDEYSDDEEDPETAHPYKRDRRLSMPGSLDGHFLDDDGFGEHEQEEAEGEEAEEAEGNDEQPEDGDVEEEFDEDLLHRVHDMADFPF